MRLSRSSFALVLLLLLPLFPLWPHAPAELINLANGSRLKVAWIYDTGESTEPVEAGGRPPKFEATPVYAAGRLYLATTAGSVIALDAENGKEIWKIDLHIQRNANYGDFVSRGLALRGEKLYVATVDARLVCLDRSTGQFCPGFGVRGQVDLVAGLRRKPQWAGEYGVTSPPAIYRDLVIVGSTVADNSRLDMASGEVRAFDAATGVLRLQPHFLFNALNAISSVMHEDVPRADQMLERLCDFLRATLRAPESPMAPISTELALVRLYLNVTQSSLEDRLRFDICCDPLAVVTQLPSLLLQPLVENAIEHGQDPGSGRVDIAIAVRRDGELVRITIRDHGTGPFPPAKGRDCRMRTAADRIWGSRGDTA